MNLLECYIVEIHSEKQSDYLPNYLIIDLTYNCYGVLTRTEHTVLKEDWQKEKQQGYFWGLFL